MDFRSDTVTRPCTAMVAAMSRAEVGDDVFGEDLSVRQLEETLADMAGFEAGLFVASGTQANLVSLLTHTTPGNEVITFQDSHIVRYERAGMARVAGLQAHTLPLTEALHPRIKDMETAIRPANVHFPTTSLICLENTHNGSYLPMDFLQDFQAFRVKHLGIATHLDGARLFNASVATRAPLAELSKGFDSVTLCLSKGLGAPAGSVVCGSKGFIEEARRHRKMLGGSMRQIGYVAAAGLYALKNNFTRLEEDHENAAFLFNALQGIEGVNVADLPNRTNMIFLSIPGKDPQQLAAQLKTQGVAIFPGEQIRLVCHINVTRADCETLVEEIQNFMS